MTHDIKEQPRKLAGTAAKDGGRYDFKQQTPDNVQLKVYEDDNPEGGFEGEGLLKLALSLARQTGNRFGMSDAAIEDIAQDAVLSALTTQRQKGKPITGGYMRTVTRSLVGRTIDTHKRHEDSKAYKMAKERFSALEAEGVAVTSEVREQVRDQIIAGWHDPRHKPSKDFLDVPVYVSADAIPNFESTFAAPSHAEAEEASEAQRLFDQFEDKKLSKRDTKLLFWNAVAASADGVPTVNRGQIASKDARRLIGNETKKTPGAIVNARESAERFADGTISATEARDLFLPFGDVAPAEKDAIVAMLLNRQHNAAHAAWTAAVETAAARPAV